MIDRPPDRLALALLSAGHLSVDLCQGAIPAMLPFFVSERHLSYAAAAGLVLAQTASSSVLQPLFGQLSDRRPAAWLMPAGVALAGCGLAASALLPTYGWIWLAIALGGIGVAGYHPEGARYASHASGGRRAAGMSVFSVGGNAGFALGPVLATPILLLFGLRGGPAIAAVPLAVALALTAGLPRVAGHRPAPAGPQAAAGGRDGDRWGAFLTLTGAVLSRSILFYGLNTFVPLYWIGVLHQPPGAGGVALAALLIAGAAGTLLGGRLGDRFPRRTVVVVTLALTGPLLLAVLLTSQPLAAVALIVPLGVCLYAPSSIMVVLGQEYLPSRMGTASGVTLGLALSIGGVATPGLGFVADHAGLREAMLLLLTMPALATLLALRLPRQVMA